MVLRVICTLLFVVAMPWPTLAQPTEGPWRDRARTFLVVRIADALNLNEQEALKVSNVIRQADGHREELIKQRQALEDKLRAALDKQPPDAAELARLISEGNDIDQKLALVWEDSFRDFQKFLTVEQQARLMLFRRGLQSEIRRAVQGRRAQARRRGWRGGGPGGQPTADE